MTLYPNDYDTDLELPRVDDNVTEIGGIAIDALRDAMFAVQGVLGINPQGSVGNIASFLAVSFDTSGHILPAALSGIGLVTLPITDAEVANSSISEAKLVLDHSTASLYAAIQAALSQYASIYANFSLLNSSFVEHIYGVAFPDGYINRHVASHIDINDGYIATHVLPHYIGNDPRDVSYHNFGLYGKDGYIRNAKTVMDALIQINNDFVLHALSADGYYHTAAFISLDTSLYNTIPQAANTVQKAFDFLDVEQTLILEEHRSEMHSTGIPKHHDVVGLLSGDGYHDGYNVSWGPFACSALNDITNISSITFTNPGNNSLDWAFAQINAGDYVRVNFGGFEARYPIEQVIYVPATSYTVVIDGYNILQTSNASAILEKAHFDENYYGILAVCGANHNYYFNPANPVDVGYPYAGRGAALNYVPGSYS